MADEAGISDGKREMLDGWMSRCRDSNLDEEEFAYFLDAESTREEIAAFMSPFECAGELTDLVMQTRAPALAKAKQADSVLIEGLRRYVSEMGRNARTIGRTDMADQIGALTNFQMVLKIEQAPSDFTLELDLQQAIADDVRDDIYDNEDLAVQNLYRIVKEWMSDLYMSIYVMRPLAVLDVELDAFYNLSSLGVERRVTVNEALVARLDG